MRRPRARRGVLTAAALVALPACAPALQQECTLIGTPSGVVVDLDALPAGARGEVCLVGGDCVQVPTGDLPIILDMPAQPATAEIEVRLDGRPVERLSVP